MKTMHLKTTLILFIIGTSLAAQARTIFPRYLYAANLSGKARVQDTRTVQANCHKDIDTGEKFCDEFELAVIASSVINNKAIINLATGNPISHMVPRTLVLAFAVPVDSVTTGAGQLVVYDSIASNIVVVVGELQVPAGIASSKLACQTLDGEKLCATEVTAFQGLATLHLNAAGIPGINSIDGGDLNVYVSATVGPGGFLKRATVTGSGFIDATSTTPEPDPDTGGLVDFTETLHVLVPSLTITTGKFLGLSQ